jgi:hypothetical protein
VPPHAGALATPLQPLAAPFEALATMLQTVTTMLQALALSLPFPPAVFVPATLQSLAVAFPVSPLTLESVSMPLQPFPTMLETPAIMPAMTLVAGMPAVRLPLGTLDREGVGRADLGRQGRSGEAQGSGKGERRVKTCHAFLPAAGPRGSKWSGVTRTGG